MNNPLPSRVKDMTGLRFGRLLVLEYAGRAIGGGSWWRCRCDCGNEKVIRQSNLRGGTKSCGCVGREILRKQRKGHHPAIFKDISGLDNGVFSVVGSAGCIGKNSRYGWISVCKYCGDVGVRTSAEVIKLKSCGCLSFARFQLGQYGSDNPTWKGGRHIDENGYVRLWVSAKRKFVREHVLIMSQMLGRPLRRNETVHHKNGNRSDNKLENLELWNHSHGPGQRVKDMVQWAQNILKEYGHLFPEK